MKLATWVANDEGFAVIDIDDGELAHLQRMVGGMVELVRLTPTLDMWVNEEGKIHDLPVNHRATRLYWAAYGIDEIDDAKLRGVDYIVGDVVLTGGSDSDGETKSLSQSQLTDIHEWLNGDFGRLADILSFPRP